MCARGAADVHTRGSRCAHAGQTLGQPPVCTRGRRRTRRRRNHAVWRLGRRLGRRPIVIRRKLCSSNGWLIYCAPAAHLWRTWTRFRTTHRLSRTGASSK
eukprot:128692-Pyramimonas_sp.AAC.2